MPYYTRLPRIYSRKLLAERTGLQLAFSPSQAWSRDANFLAKSVPGPLPVRLLAGSMRVQVLTAGDNGRITAIQAVDSDGEPHSIPQQRSKHASGDRTSEKCRQCLHHRDRQTCVHLAGCLFGHHGHRRQRTNRATETLCVTTIGFVMAFCQASLCISLEVPWSCSSAQSFTRALSLA